jgi:AAA domain, putative AbiEii toxin, Type IV TA system
MPQTTNEFTENLQGSIWHRWEPHIHTPGTILNNQYTGTSAPEDFLVAIENSSPIIRTLGITDYYSIESYEEILQKKLAGRLLEVGLIFPNIEIRFDIGTSTNNPINAHLLINPETIDHIAETKRFLRELTFSAYQETFHCDKDDLIKLGKLHDKTNTEAKKALEIGTNQFKVNFTQLKEKIKASQWAQDNILIAVSANSGDGTSGLQTSDASFDTLRTEIEKYSHIIFSSKPKQREFWIGNGAATKEQLLEKWNGTKPCLHGSDAHSIDKVGKPDLDRMCWIRGDVTFESLRQACIEPEGRSYIGLTPTSSSVPSRIIESVTVKNCNWLTTPTVPVNSGLVAVIGARGSGKTALADLIAAGSYALIPHLNERSFIYRAQNLIKNEEVVITWNSGETTSNHLKYFNAEGLWDFPKVQYLSQQFVEELCSSEGLTDKLMAEIERVIFQAHLIGERMGTSTFEELSQLKSNLSRSEREREENTLDDYSTRIIEESNKKDNIDPLKKQLENLKSIIVNDKAARQKLASNNNKAREAEHERVSKALDKVRAKVDLESRQLLALTNLKSAAENSITNSFPNYPKILSDKFPDVNLTTAEWDSFKIKFEGDVITLLNSKIAAVNKSLGILKGNAIVFTDGAASLIPVNDAVLENQTISILHHELLRIQSLIGIDRENAKRYASLSDKISKDETKIINLSKEIEDAEKADQKIKKLLNEKKNTYQRIFDAIIEEESVYHALYEPLMLSLKAETGTLSKLTFNVRRTADIVSWAQEGENLLDLRKSGAFKGKGTLLDAAKSKLLKAWEEGSAEEISTAMDSFRASYSTVLLDHSPYEKTDRINYRQWGKKIADWLYSTEHILVSYGVQYDNVDIKQLSPGTRGIVLLLLYLSIDKEDDRPLIIDQPEENLDPKSIFDELVPKFRDAKLRRQIIIITHNANLVVNTDADQVIIASCGDHRNGELPLIGYQSGGLENKDIRIEVCRILEGGEIAFRERAKRLRLKF